MTPNKVFCIECGLFGLDARTLRKQNKIFSRDKTEGKLATNSANYISIKGTAVAQWLRCCATNRKVAGSIKDGVTGIFH